MSQEQLFKLGQVVELSITGKVIGVTGVNEPMYQVEFRDSRGIYVGMAIVPQSAIVIGEQQAVK